MLRAGRRQCFRMLAFIVDYYFLQLSQIRDPKYFRFPVQTEILEPDIMPLLCAFDSSSLFVCAVFVVSCVFQVFLWLSHHSFALSFGQPVCCLNNLLYVVKGGGGGKTTSLWMMAPSQLTVHLEDRFIAPKVGQNWWP
jgi:hypothetical protein